VVFGAIVRKNHGCTHFIFGRDHAAVGDYYGDFAAQELLDRFAHIGIAPITFESAFHCAVCDCTVSEMVCPPDPSAWAVPSEPTADELGETPRDRGYTVRRSRYYLNGKLDNPQMVFAKR
jgi:sulfate adenylyltransferase